MKTFILSLVLLLSGFSAVAEGNEPLHRYDNPDWAVHAMKVIEAQANNSIPMVLKEHKVPASQERGFVPAEDWVSGFYPGILWHLYEYTGDEYWKRHAETVTGFLFDQQYNTKEHDTGFRMGLSYGKGYGMTGNENYKKVIIQSSESLASRFVEKAQVIMSWDPRPSRGWKCPVIVDNMMNLELLMKASEISGDSKYAKIAVCHANTTMKNHYRKDFSCPHVVDYDPVTGKKIRDDYNNGFSDWKVATWSRGQGWGLYGFTMMYRYTEDKKYLKQAEHIADFLLAHPNMPEDLIPYWDLAAPKIPTQKDASAAALLASGLLELSSFSKENSQRYFNAAEKILKKLSSEEYLAIPGTNGNFAIKHAVGNYLMGMEVDNGIVYADYYYIEALMRYLKLSHGLPITNN